MRHCYVVRVFTVGSDGGNPLGVIPDSTGLTDDHKQAIASDLGFSETVFLDWPEGAVPVLRIFTPAVELPFAGHPLVGTAWVLNEMGPSATAMRIAIGDVAVVPREDAMWVTLPTLPSRVGATAADGSLGVSGRRAWRVAVPTEYLLVELDTPSHVEAAEPDLATVARLTEGLFLFSGGDADVRARFFAPRLGVDEDPATGSAAAAYAVMQVHEGVRTGACRILQGRSDHLSSIALRWDGDVIQLGGSVVKDEVRVLDV